MSKPKFDKRIIIPFTEDNINDMLKLCGNTFLGLRNRAIIITSVNSGLRMSELINMDIGDIDDTAGTIKVFGKGAKERVVSFGRDSKIALYRYLEIRAARCYKYNIDPPDTLWLTEECQPFSTRGIQITIRRLGIRAGLKHVRCSAHTFRHTCITNSLKNGATKGRLNYLPGTLHRQW
jgi:integrase/recombinase XerC/integrase/recombinase XerD